ncbi:type II toxin-antitoxin system PemK/MazF family toxin [Thioalkalicoccus limnaeus]|uniref:type II toxin-antitoxin system PemK/MazF family toxin n=1 Tax=Thioalkalicoccus limnaeus TaxID=120681 RepID=UPI003F7450C1
MVKTVPSWVPDRQEVIGIDCNPQRGRKMRDVYPFLVLSPKAFNERTSRVIGLPMTTAAYNPFAVAIGTAGASPDKLSIPTGSGHRFRSKADTCSK